MLNAFAIKRICPSNSNGSERLKQNIWFHWKCLFMHIRNDLIMAQTGKQKNYKGIYFDLREDPRLKQFCFPKLGLFQYIFNLHNFSFSRCAGDFREENWLLVVYGKHIRFFVFWHLISRGFCTQVQEVPNDDYEETRAFVGPILHISCPVDVELKKPASIRIPVASEQDLQKLRSLSISNVRICYRSTQDSSQENTRANWLKIVFLFNK